MKSTYLQTGLTTMISSVAGADSADIVCDDTPNWIIIKKDKKERKVYV